jgi:hypothetical protein
MPLFSQGHYEWLAKLLKYEIEIAHELGQWERKVSLEGFARRMAHEFEQGSNPRFNRKLFLKACGVEE